VEGIPATTAPRTLLDLAAVLSRSKLEQAVNEAEVQRLTNPLSLADLIERYPGRHGIGAMRAVLANLHPGGTVTRSELEARFRGFLKSNGLPPPLFNAGVLVDGRWMECDCVWRPQRLAVELDGRAVHGTAAAFERDRARDRVLNAAGWRVIRITWRQLHSEADAVAADLSKMLAGRKKP
jgi:hypothetical protein